jgi:hypothetical protein
VAARHDVALHASGRGSLMTIYTARHELIPSDGAARVQARAKAHPGGGSARASMPDVARALGYSSDNQSTWKLCDGQARPRRHT